VTKITTTQEIMYVAKNYSKLKKRWFCGVEKEELEELKEWTGKMNTGRPNYYQIFEKIVTVETVETLIFY